MNTELAEKVSKLKKNLPKGWSRILAEKCHVSKPTVTRAINDFNTKSKILEEAIKMAEENKIEEIKKALQLHKKVDNL